MRCIARFDTEEKARKFFAIIQAQGIVAQIDKEQEEFEIWVKLEDQIPFAEELYQNFLEGREPEEKKIHPVEKKEIHIPKPSEVVVTQVYVSPLTRFFIFICAVIFLVALYQQSAMKQVSGEVFPRFLPIQQQLMYDYPVALQFATELMDEYTVAKETDIATLPAPGQALIRKIQENPPWEGVYTLLLDWKDREKLLQAKLFSNIASGEVWRLFTPTILHVDFLHFLFNMLWLWMLGKMMERNMHLFTYLVFVVVTAVLTNTLQYLMTGPFFMGFSGVVSAMAGYIWVRKKRAPWEIYPIDFGTLIFLWVFIFGMMTLQIVAFFLEILHIVSFQLNIANTAHVSGVVLGLLFGRVFKRK